MVGSITSLTGNGLKDWFVQRISAVILAIYAFFIVGFILGHHPLDYTVWFLLFHTVWMRAFTILALLSLIAHAWVGIWTVLTDYVTCRLVRGSAQVIIIIAFLVCIVWCINILWS
ncbi:MAG: succinate dehydrogenase, hydrophobic membrane anchor protein [Gammaproteobacteria bacterium]|nr:succinate dehydrogenase, hydrophobic membrane anchor protein [Gammaproteobacteria bacterium]